MAWMKAPEALMARFGESLPQAPDVQARKMFGYPAAFVNGNMFAGVFQDRIFVRVSPEEQAALETKHGPLPFEPMPGRAMKGYVRVPDEIVGGAALSALLASAFAYTAALPPKEKKEKRPKTAR